MYLNMFRASISPAIHSSVGMSHFTFNKMAHHHTTTETSEAASMKPYLVNGQNEEVILTIPHAHLI
jgi:hypothetical protein